MSEDRRYNPEKRRQDYVKRDVSKYAPPGSRSKISGTPSNKTINSRTKNTGNDYYGLERNRVEKRRISETQRAYSEERRRNNNRREIENDSFRPERSRSAERLRTENSEQRPLKRRKVSKKEIKRRKRKKRIKIFVALFLAFIILAGTFCGMKVSGILDKVDIIDEDLSENSYIDNGSLYQSEEVINVILVGIDKLENGEENGRSDSMMLVSIDTANRKIKLTSFMRDCWVEIPGHGMNKLNAAHSYGGMALLIDTIEYNFRIKVDKYIVANFEMFSDIVEALGGIDIEVEQYEAEYINSVSELKIDYGSNVHLNGEEALLYCRIRYLDSDFYRTMRQRKVMSQIISQCREANIFKLVSIADKAAENLQTNLTKKEISNLMFKTALKYRKYEVMQFRIPADGACWDETIDGQMVLAIDREKNVSLLYDFIYGEIPQTEPSGE